MLFLHIFKKRSVSILNSFLTTFCFQIMRTFLRKKELLQCGFKKSTCFALSEVVTQQFCPQPGEQLRQLSKVSPKAVIFLSSTQVMLLIVLIHFVSYLSIYHVAATVVSFGVIVECKRNMNPAQSIITYTFHKNFKENHITWVPGLFWGGQDITFNLNT